MVRKVRLGSLFCEDVLDVPRRTRPTRKISSQAIGKGGNKLAGAQLGCRVIVILNTEEDGRARNADLSPFGPNNTSRVLGILIGGIEVNPTDGKLNIELILN
jgi:hypothetical protein